MQRDFLPGGMDSEAVWTQRRCAVEVCRRAVKEGVLRGCGLHVLGHGWPSGSSYGVLRFSELYLPPRAMNLAASTESWLRARSAPTSSIGSL